MRLTDKDKIKELLTYEKNNVLMSDNEYKELKLGQLEDILESHNIKTLEELDGLLSYVKQIKKIEQELGVELSIICKALDTKSTIYVKDGKSIVAFDGFIANIRYLTKYQLILDDSYSSDEGMYLNFEDYGKTWALTREELL